MNKFKVDPNNPLGLQITNLVMLSQSLYDLLNCNLTQVSWALCCQNLEIIYCFVIIAISEHEKPQMTIIFFI